jgi:hypothetical protein
VSRIARDGLKVVDDVYPDLHVERSTGAPSAGAMSDPCRTIVHRGKAAVVIAVNRNALVAAARAATRSSNWSIGRRFSSRPTIRCSDQQGGGGD